MKRGRGSAKSRSGCQNCKNRRIKCDETKPACDACVRGGITCPGYARPLKWSRKHELHAASPAATSLRSSRRYNRPYGEPEAWPSNEAPPDFPSSTDLSEAASRMSDWLDLNMNEADTELAFQDATVLMSQDLTVGTPPFVYPGLMGSETSFSLADTLPQQHLNSTVEISEERIPETASSAPSALGNPQAAGSISGQDGQKALSSSDKSEAGNRPTAFLHTLYRLSSPKSLSRLTDEDFVHYYFNHVCRLHSCFDSDVNPFRSLAAKWWSTCGTLSLTIQSMAIAHIANWYPYMASLGISKRGQAWRSLQKDLQLQRLGRLDLEKVLLCLFLLGTSASWQPGAHLGLQYLHITRNLIQARLRGPPTGSGVEGLSDFWASALVHWEMLASFVDPVAITVFDGHGVPELHAQELQTPVMPHPWTGVATELHYILAEVGRVSRRRHRCSTPDNALTEEVHRHDIDHRWLQNLEKLLLTSKVPDEESIEDCKDATTSNTDFLRTAEACRGFGLLEIYRLCPRLLNDRIGNSSSDIGFPFTIPDDHTGYARDIDSYLSSFALQTLNIVAQISFSSGASCRLQPLLMVACASQLRPPDRGDVPPDAEGPERYENVIQYRYFVEARMLSLSRKLPQAPILRAMEIIKEGWDRLDSAEEGHWIDVMHEKGWQTILA